jgi:hypothetical protein
MGLASTAARQSQPAAAQLRFLGCWIGYRPGCKLQGLLRLSAGVEPYGAETAHDHPEAELEATPFRNAEFVSSEIGFGA